MFRNTARTLGDRADRLVDAVLDLEHHSISEIVALTTWA
jgi:hypothetical protein